jgi:hypothetical protein
MAATTLESTPPDMATTTRVCDGGFGRPRELSATSRGIVFVRFRECPAIYENAVQSQSLVSALIKADQAKMP